MYCPLDELAGLLRTRAISPVEVARTMIERTERLDPRLGAYITFTPEAALERAGHAFQSAAEWHRRSPASTRSPDGR